MSARSRSTTRLRLTALASGALLLAGCGGGEPSEAGSADGAPAVRQVEVEGTEYEFTGIPPEAFPAEYEIEFVNTGDEQHELSIVRLKEGTTAMSVIEAQEDGEDPATLVEEFLATTGPVAPGSSGTVRLDARDGASYGYACLLPAPDGEPHALHGMSGELKVTTSAA